MTDNKIDAKSTPLAKTEPVDQSAINGSKTDKAGSTQRTNAPIDATTLTSNASATEVPSKTTPEPEATMKKVTISIAGINYSVFCPVNEESELREAVHYINDFTVNIKREAPHLKQENLLVLACLNLYEKIHANNKLATKHQQDSDQTEVLLNKVIADAKSIL